MSFSSAAFASSTCGSRCVFRLAPKVAVATARRIAAPLVAGAVGSSLVPIASEAAVAVTFVSPATHPTPVAGKKQASNKQQGTVNNVGRRRRSGSGSVAAGEEAEGKAAIEGPKWTRRQLSAGKVQQAVHETKEALAEPADFVDKCLRAFSQSKLVNAGPFKLWAAEVAPHPAVAELLQEFLKRSLAACDELSKVPAASRDGTLREKLVRLKQPSSLSSWATVGKRLWDDTPDSRPAVTPSTFFGQQGHLDLLKSMLLDCAAEQFLDEISTLLCTCPDCSL